MSRRDMYKLEMEYKRSLENWDRGKAKKAVQKTSFRPAYLLPPGMLPIQGILLPKPTEESDKRRLKKRREQAKPARRNAVKAKKPVKPKRRFHREPRREKALKTESRAISLLCKCCDFRDKLTGKCLVIRLGGECPYRNGVYSHAPKKPMKVPVRSR